MCGVALYGFSATRDINSLPFEKALGIQMVSDAMKNATQTESTSFIDEALPEDFSAEVTTSAGYKLVSRAVRGHLREGHPTAALKMLETDKIAKNLKNSEFDRIKAQIAHSYLIEGKIEKAGHIAGQAASRSGKTTPLAGWVAGQAAWRTGDYLRAAVMFGKSARATSNNSAWLVSASSYWAARASTKAGETDAAEDWYAEAAKYPRTFYGLISLRVLGRNYDFNWDFPELSSSERKALGLDLKVSAALRLSRQGELSAATTTLGSSQWMRSEKGRRSLLAYFQYKKDPALTMFLARKTKDEQGRLYDTALYPESPWEPKGGYDVDKALIHALIRQESRFNPNAISSTGATGLMQIMPATAEYMSSGASSQLSHPETNISIGQKYVKVLLNDKVVNNDLFNMAVAYNAGPGNLSRWKRELKEIDDPMLFIESIPAAETRAFVERVMVNYWIYRQRMGLDVPSLDAIAMLDHDAPIKTVRSIFADKLAYNQ